RALDALEQEEPEHGDAAEREHRERVHAPRLLALGVDPTEAIQGALDRREDAVAGGRAPVEDPRDVGAEQWRRETDEPQEGRGLSPGLPAHDGLVIRAVREPQGRR